MGLTGARGAPDDLQFADLPGLFRRRHGAPSRAPVFVAPEEDQPAARILSVLRRVEPAVRGAAVDFDRGRLVGGAMDGARQGRTHAQAVDGDQRRRQHRHAWLLQIWRLPARQFRRARRVDRGSLPAARVEHRAPRRHQLLHLRDPLLHARRLSPPRQARRALPRLRLVRDLLPAPRRGADHAPDRARAPVCGAAPGNRASDPLRTRSDHPRPVPEGGARRRLPLAGGGEGL